MLLVIFGVYKLFSQRHPRFLARIGPSHLAMWSFLLATAHGAGLMLVPVVLGLCTNTAGAHGGHPALLGLAGGSLALTLAAATVHTGVMVLTSGAIAWVVYRYVGLGLLRQGWLNLDLLWAVLLIVVGGIAVLVALLEYSRGAVA